MGEAPWLGNGSLEEVPFPLGLRGGGRGMGSGELLTFSPL